MKTYNQSATPSLLWSANDNKNGNKKGALIPVMPLLLLACFSPNALADDSNSAWDLSQIDHKKWQCEYCPSETKSFYSVGINIGYLNDDVYRFGDRSGIEDGLNVYPHFDLWQIDPNSYNWSVAFAAQSLDAKQLDVVLRQPNFWRVSARYQDFPTRSYDKLYSPFSLQEGNHLVLPSDWQPQANMQNLDQNMVPSAQHQQLALGVDWQRFDLGLALKSNDIKYSIDYHRTEKDGTAAASTTQIINAFYLPMPVSQSIEIVNLGLSSNYDNLRWGVGYSMSRFSNTYQDLIYDIPYQPLAVNATQGQTALSPDNVAYNVSANLELKMTDSSLKAYVASGEHKQNESLLPYTLNVDLNHSLPVDAPTLKVATKHLNLRYHWQPNRQWTVNGKFDYHGRNNQSAQWVFTPISNDVYQAGEVSNIPYDAKQRKYSLNTKWRFNGRQFVSLEWIEHNKQREFEIKTETREHGLIAKLNLPMDNNSLLSFKGEKLNRSGQQWQLIDLVQTEYNPLLQKFTFADREHSRVGISYALPFNQFGLNLAGDVLRNHYKNSTLGLDSSHARTANISLDWRINQQQLINGFYEWQSINSTMNAGDATIAGNWTADSADTLRSYGINFSAHQLFDKPLTFELRWTESTGKSSMAVVSRLNNENLPQVTSAWQSVIADLTYQMENQWKVKLSYQYDKFASADYALDSIYPNAVKNLMSFGALSHNYQVDYLLLSLTHQF